MRESGERRPARRSKKRARPSCADDAIVDRADSSGVSGVRFSVYIKVWVLKGFNQDLIRVHVGFRNIIKSQLGLSQNSVLV